MCDERKLIPCLFCGYCCCRKVTIGAGGKIKRVLDVPFDPAVVGPCRRFKTKKNSIAGKRVYAHQDGGPDAGHA